MKRRILISYLTVVILILVTLEVPLAIGAHRYERSGLMEQTTSAASGLAVLASQDLENGGLASLKDLVARYHYSGGAEVMVTIAGKPVADSDHDARRDMRKLAHLLAQSDRGSTASGWYRERGNPYAVAAVPFHTETPNDALAQQGSLVLFGPATITYQRIHEAWIVLAVFAGITLLAAAAVGLRAATAISRPLADLASSVTRFGRGELAVRSATSGPREIAALASEFNGMADRIQESVVVQSEFVADASHQLRSPLAALRLRLEMMEADATEEVSRALADANSELQRLSRLVDGLLTLGRADSLSPAKSTVDVTAIAESRLEAWSDLASERGLDLSLRVTNPPPPPHQLVDGDLDQILDNFLSNAIEATPEGGSVRLEVVSGPDGTQVAVTDTGRGMSEEDLERAFDRFWQGPEGATGSSGLGLAIARQLGQRNGAELSLASAPRGGVRAQIDLPD